MATATDTSGQDLLDLANSSWNSKHGDYRGIEYHIAVNHAEDGVVVEKGTKHRRKVQRAQAATTVTHIFDVARSSEADRLAKIAADVNAKLTGEGTAIHDFASEVASSLQVKESGAFGVFDPVSLITLIMSIIQQVIPLFAICHPPKPVTPPVPVPVPAPVTV